MPEKSTPNKKVLEEEDTPAYQEMVLFYLSTGVKTVLIAWCITIISLAYIKLPDSKWWVADQRIDATYAAGILGGLLGSLGVTVANQGKKKEEKNGNGKNVENGSGYQTIIIKQPIELITRKPDVIRVDPITGKDVKNDGSLEP
tara:strand:+ start:61 stop:492 length:432 start_codon:yes stop_codon:yes gene_type:complete